MLKQAEEDLYKQAIKRLRAEGLDEQADSLLAER